MRLTEEQVRQLDLRFWADSNVLELFRADWQEQHDALAAKDADLAALRKVAEAARNVWVLVPVDRQAWGFDELKSALDAHDALRKPTETKEADNA